MFTSKIIIKILLASIAIGFSISALTGFTIYKTNSEISSSCPMCLDVIRVELKSYGFPITYRHVESVQDFATVDGLIGMSDGQNTKSFEFNSFFLNSVIWSMLTFIVLIVILSAKKYFNKIHMNQNKG